MQQPNPPANPPMASTNAAIWTLYGTTDCHLCDQAEALLMQCGAAYPIAWQHLDIADLPEDTMMQLADNIPVLVTTQATLYWPFGLGDLAKLANQLPAK